MKLFLLVISFLYCWWKRMPLNKMLAEIFGDQPQQEPRNPVNKEKLVPLSKYCENHEGNVVIHRDLDRWYCVFNKEEVEVIDGKEIYVDLGPGAPSTINLQIKDTRQLESIAEVFMLVVNDNRIEAAVTPAETTRKRFELPKESKLLDYMFVEVTL